MLPTRHGVTVLHPTHQSWQQMVILSALHNAALLHTTRCPRQSIGSSLGGATACYQALQLKTAISRHAYDGLGAFEF